MEEILASIRRILNDDEVPAEPSDAAKDDDVLVLDESMLVTEPAVAPSAGAPSAAAASAAVLPVADLAGTDLAGTNVSGTDVSGTDVPAAAAESEASRPVALPPEADTADKAPDQGPFQAVEAMTPPSATDPRGQPAPTPNLLAPETAAAAASSVGSLVRSLAAGRATQVYTGGPTLEDMVRAELRPLLKEWLDVHLPPMVERLVRAEIERVVGREVP
jgi:uncharacterized protein